MPEELTTLLYDPTVGKLVATLIGIVIVLAVVRVLNRAMARVVTDTDARYRIRKLVVFAGYAAVFLIVGAIFSDKFGAFTVAFGVAGAGIAFALQEVIASVAGWISIAFGGVFRIGDRVQFGGTRGDVIDIGVLRTTVMECGDWIAGDLYNGRIVRLPNSLVFKEPVRNYSGDFPFLWDEVTLPVRYGSDRGATRELLLNAALGVVAEYTQVARESWPALVAKYRIEDASVEPMVTMLSDENWMTFTIRYVVDYRRRRSAKDQIVTRILDGIDASGGAVSIASASFEVASVPSLQVDVKETRSD